MNLDPPPPRKQNKKLTHQIARGLQSHNRRIVAPPITKYSTCPPRVSSENKHRGIGKFIGLFYSLVAVSKFRIWCVTRSREISLEVVTSGFAVPMSLDSYHFRFCWYMIFAGGRLRFRFDSVTFHSQISSEKSTQTRRNNKHFPPIFFIINQIMIFM